MSATGGLLLLLLVLVLLAIAWIICRGYLEYKRIASFTPEPRYEERIYSEGTHKYWFKGVQIGPIAAFFARRELESLSDRAYPQVLYCDKDGNILERTEAFEKKLVEYGEKIEKLRHEHGGRLKRAGEGYNNDCPYSYIRILLSCHPFQKKPFVIS